jgi:hypothetical protein
MEMIYEKVSPHLFCFGDEGLLGRAQLEETLLGSLFEEALVGGPTQAFLQLNTKLLSKLPPKTCKTNKASLKQTIQFRF